MEVQSHKNHLQVRHLTVVAALPAHHEGMARYRGSGRPSPVELIGLAFRWGRPRPCRVVEAVGSSGIRRHRALRAVVAARPVAVWSPVEVSQGPTAVLVALGHHPAHHLGVGFLTTKAPRLGVVRLGLGLVVAAYLLCLGLVAAALLCLGLVVAVASRPFRVRLGVPVVVLDLSVFRRRRGVPRVGT